MLLGYNQANSANSVLPLCWSTGALEGVSTAPTSTHRASLQGSFYSVAGKKRVSWIMVPGSIHIPRELATNANFQTLNQTLWMRNSREATQQLAV